MAKPKPDPARVERALDVNKRGHAAYMLTQAEQDRFWRCVDHWQAKLGLLDWRITRKTGESAGYLATTEKFDAEQRQCRIALSTDWGMREEPTPVSIERTAVHELLHIRGYDLSRMAVDRGATYDLVHEAEHKLINVLEVLLVPVATEF